MFQLESEMETSFEDLLSTYSRDLLVMRQVKGLAGIPDYLVVRSKGQKQAAVAIELKLSQWRRALEQAYKYRSFCVAAIVVLDDKFIKRALRNISEFHHFNVGLASLSVTGIFTWHHKPKVRRPYSEFLTRKLSDQLNNESCHDPFISAADSVPERIDERFCLC